MGKQLELIPCVMVTHAGRVLLLQRASDVPRNPNVWVIPGGKLNENETPRACAARELKEETGIDIHPANLDIIDIFHSPDPAGNYYNLAVYHFDLKRRPNLVIEPHKFQGYGWFTVAEVEGMKAARPAAEVAGRLRVRGEAT